MPRSRSGTPTPLGRAISVSGGVCGMPDKTRAGESLRVAMVAPPWFSIPPQAYGGIEAVVADLVRALSARGHHVTLVGAGRDRTPGRFLRTFENPQGGRLGEPLLEVVHAA